MANNRVINPRYPDSPARMADGRLFTDYGSQCRGAQPKQGNPGFEASFDDKQRKQQTGEILMKADRSLTVMRGGIMGGCVDTMVPELTKRVCGWDGCRTLMSHPAGIGQGRLYLPGRKDLVAGDPDVLAAATAFDFGTFSQNPHLYVAAGVVPVSPAAVIQTRTANRYSAPYGPTQ